MTAMMIKREKLQTLSYFSYQLLQGGDRYLMNELVGLPSKCCCDGHVGVLVKQKGETGMTFAPGVPVTSPDTYTVWGTTLSPEHVSPPTVL